MTRSKSGKLLAAVVIAAAGLCAVSASAQVAKAPAAVPTGPGSLSGVWVNNEFKTSARFGTRDQLQYAADGQLPPMRPEVAALLDKRLKDSDDGHPFATTLSECLPAGMPQEMFGPKLLPFQILETPGQVSILFESMSTFRIIHLNEPHSEDPDPSFQGESVGHWEGDTLVVDTIAISDHTTIDTVGMPHSDALHLVERFHRTGPDTMELNVLFEDPKTFTKSWTAHTSYKAPKDMRVGYYVCDNNRNRPGANGVATGVK